MEETAIPTVVRRISGPGSYMTFESTTFTSTTILSREESQPPPQSPSLVSHNEASNIPTMDSCLEITQPTTDLGQKRLLGKRKREAALATEVEIWNPTDNHGWKVAFERSQSTTSTPTGANQTLRSSEDYPPLDPQVLFDTPQALHDASQENDLHDIQTEPTTRESLKDPGLHLQDDGASEYEGTSIKYYDIGGMYEDGAEKYPYVDPTDLYCGEVIYNSNTQAQIHTPNPKSGKKSSSSPLFMSNGSGSLSSSPPSGDQPLRQHSYSPVISESSNSRTYGSPIFSNRSFTPLLIQFQAISRPTVPGDIQVTLGNSSEGLSSRRSTHKPRPLSPSPYLRATSSRGTAENHQSLADLRNERVESMVYPRPHKLSELESGFIPISRRPKKPTRPFEPPKPLSQSERAKLVANMTGTKIPTQHLESTPPPRSFKTGNSTRKPVEITPPLNPPPSKSPEQTIAALKALATHLTAQHTKIKDIYTATNTTFQYKGSLYLAAQREILANHQDINISAFLSSYDEDDDEEGIEQFKKQLEAWDTALEQWAMMQKRIMYKIRLREVEAVIESREAVVAGNEAEDE